MNCIYSFLIALAHNGDDMHMRKNSAEICNLKVTYHLWVNVNDYS